MTTTNGHAPHTHDRSSAGGPGRVTATGTLATIIRFEVGRTLRSRAFWLTTLMFPLLIVVVGVIITVSNQSANVDQAAGADISFQYADPSGLIDGPLATSMGGTKTDDSDAGIAAVKAGGFQAFFDYPADPARTPTRVYGQDVGIFDSNKYNAVASTLLTRSAEKRIDDPQAVAIVTGAGVSFDLTTYRDGQPTDGMGAAVAPGLLAVLFFLLVVMLGNRMLSAFTEEKENRVAEMVLTTMNASTLLAGKVISLLILGVVQMLVTALVPIFAIATGRLGALNVGQVSVDPKAMTLGILLLLGGFALNMTSVVTVGMIMPSAREANSMYAPIILLTVIPLYLSAMMVTAPDSAPVLAVTFFPWSAAITSLVRNAFGNLPDWQAAIVIAEQFGVAAVILWFANKIARFGLISYDKALDVRAILRRHAPSADTRSV